MIELYKFSFEADGSMELTQTRSELSNSVTVGSVTSTRQCIDAAKRMFRRIIVITQGEYFLVTQHLRLFLILTPSALTPNKKNGRF